jgi:hypothetical protein
MRSADEQLFSELMLEFHHVHISWQVAKLSGNGARCLDLLYRGQLLTERASALALSFRRRSPALGFETARRRSTEG